MEKRNPLILPRVDLVDSIFDVALFGIKEYLEYCRNVYKFEEDITKQYLVSLNKTLKSFFIEAIDLLKYYDAPYNPSDEKLWENIESYGELSVISLNDIRLFISDHDIDEKLKDFFLSEIDTFSSVILPTIKVAKTRHLLNEDQCYDAIDTVYTHLNSLKVLIGQLKLFVKGYRSFIFDRYSDSIDQFIDEYEPCLPEGWEEVPSKQSDDSSVLKQLEKTYLLPKQVSEKTFDVPYELEIHIKEFSSSQKGYCGVYKDKPTIFFVLNSIPQPLFMRLEDESAELNAEMLYGLILHECIHLYQIVMGAERKETGYTGLPYSRSHEFRFYETEAEKALKLEYEINGLDPDLVNFHMLDDIEFYTHLLESILYFIKTEILEQIDAGQLNPCSINLEEKSDLFINSTHFFNVLKRFQIQKYEIAVKEFKEAILSKREQLEKDYVCKLTDPRKAKRTLINER